MFQKLSKEEKIHPWMDPNIPFRTNYPLQLMIIVFLFVWFVAALHPTDRKIWFIENILPVGVFFLLAFTYKKFHFSNLTYLLILIFLCFHLYGGHYTYNKTPFDEWLKFLFHTKRSYYDRIVHFLFGVFWVFPFWELLTRTSPVWRGLWVYCIPLVIVFSLSSLFEVVEWFGGQFAGKAGKDYIGLQGDIFDTQKDMGLGLLGALVSIGILAAVLYWKDRNTENE